MLGHPQPLGDFPLRQPLDLAKLEYPAASVRQSLDQSAHPVQFAAATGDPFGRRLISNDVQALYFRHGFDADDTLAPQPHQDDAARGGEEIRPEERRIGEACVRTCKYRWSTYNQKKT